MNKILKKCTREIKLQFKAAKTGDCLGKILEIRFICEFLIAYRVLHLGPLLF